MASSTSPPSRVPESATVLKLDGGNHDFKIIGYSSCHSMGVGRCIESQVFAAGGHQWRMRFYPHGDVHDCADYVSIFVEAVNNITAVEALFDIRLLNSVTRAPSVGTPDLPVPAVFIAPLNSWGFNKFMLRRDLEASDYLHDDCLTFRCNVVVIKEIEDAIDR